MKKMVMSVATLLLLIGAFTSCNFSDHSKIKRRSGEQVFGEIRQFIVADGKEAPTFYLSDINKKYANVTLRGSFDSWGDGYGMSYDDTQGFWVTYKKFRPGKYFYKFFVEPVVGEPDWINDPMNKKVEGPDKNSVIVFTEQLVTPGDLTAHQQGYAPYWSEVDGDIVVDETVSIPHVYLEDEGQLYSSVQLVGDFNGWDSFSGTIDLMYEGTGYWELALEGLLPPGKYAYKFIIDGEWKLDQYADEYSDDNSNGIITINATAGVDHHVEGYWPADDGYEVPMFYLEDDSYFDGDVAVKGSFNDWGEPIYLEFNEETEYWELNLQDLEPGEYEYKLIIYEVDGLDMNASFTRNGNSVLVVK